MPASFQPGPLAGLVVVQPRVFPDGRGSFFETYKQSEYAANGIAEAFVKTFKRDYVRINPLPDAATVLRQLTGWFDDYNENHPHSGLGMRSPKEFIQAQAT